MTYFTKIILVGFLFVQASISYSQNNIKVGVFENKPIVFKDSDNSMSGLSISILEKIAEAESWEIEYIHGSFKDTFNKLKENKIDLIVGLAYSETRAKDFFYTEETLLNNWGVVYQALDQNIVSIQELENKRIVLLERNIHSRVFDSLMKRFGFAYETVYVNSPQKLFEVLKNGDADAGIINRLASLHITSKNRIKPTSIIFNPVEVRYASSNSGSPYVVKKIDEYLFNWKTNESSYYYQQLDSWVNKKQNSENVSLVYLIAAFTLVMIAILIYIFYIKLSAIRDKKKLLVKSREQLVILDSLLDGAIIYDQKGVVQYMNVVAETMFQYKAQEVVGNNIKILMPATKDKNHDSYLVDFLNKKDVSVVGEAREFYTHRKNGESFPMRLSIVELPSQEGEGIRYLGTCVDLTSHKKQAKYMNRSKKMDALGQLTGGIAHDYNNMLAVILGFSELLSEKTKGDLKSNSYITQIIKAANRGASLTNKLLTFSRNTNGQKEAININDLIREESLMLEKTLTPRINLILDLEEDLASVFVDKSELIESIVNIAINAMHAMPDGGAFTIKTRNINCNDGKLHFISTIKGSWVHLALVDSGVGMTEEQQNRIFEPFYSTKGDAGNGLGLSQVYGFVKDQEGEVDVRSELGLGSTFDLYFPVMDGDSTKDSIDVVDNNIDVVIGSGLNKTILVVDDEIAINSLVEQVLTKAGYTVLTANSGSEVLDILKEKSVDLLLTDIIMPDMDGYTLTQLVAARHPNIKIQLMSGFSDIKEKNNVPEALLKNILKKPFSATELMHKLASNFNK